MKVKEWRTREKIRNVQSFSSPNGVYGLFSSFSYRTYRYVLFTCFVNLPWHNDRFVLYGILHDCLDLVLKIWRPCCPFWTGLFVTLCLLSPHRKDGIRADRRRWKRSDDSSAPGRNDDKYCCLKYSAVSLTPRIVTKVTTVLQSLNLQ
jgi:hypothetical protein